MHYPHMGTTEGRTMSSEHHVLVSWSGSDDESKPLIEILNRLAYQFTVKTEDTTQLEIVVESDSMRGLRDAVDELLVQLSSLED
jgi:hypothetical protein